jgi:hypothetical protein
MYFGKSGAILQKLWGNEGLSGWQKTTKFRRPIRRKANREKAVEIQCCFSSQSFWKAGSANVRCLAAVFASENEGGPGLIASGVVTAAKAITKKGRNGSDIETPTLL